jgi:hypothetical protein
MTPFRNDEANPFGRPSVWPKMPQSPMSLGVLPRAFAPAPAPAPRPVVQVVEAEVAIAAADAEMAIPEPPPAPEPPLELEPIAAPIGVRRGVPARQGLRLTPLIAAAAVGAGGMAALLLMLGVRPAMAPSAAPVAPRATLAVGEIVGGPAAPLPAPAPAASTQAAAPSPAPRLAMVRSAPHRAALAAAAPSPAAPLLNVPAPAAEPAPTSPPPALPVASVAAPVEPPAPAPPPYKPPPAPDRNAPISTHVPD